jgi:hypothetical protein
MNKNKNTLIFLMTLTTAAFAHAQDAGGGITMSTDPARAAAVERRAQEIKARPVQQTPAKPAAKAASGTKSKSQPKQSTKHKATPQAKSKGAQPAKAKGTPQAKSAAAKPSKPPSKSQSR